MELGELSEPRPCHPYAAPAYAAALAMADTHLGPDCIAIQNGSLVPRPQIYLAAMEKIFTAAR